MAMIGASHPFSQLPQYKGCIYLDYNATTPIFPEVYNAMQPYLLTSFGNPSSTHIFGAPCKDAIADARLCVSQLVNARSPLEIIFTSCGTESDNRAIDIAVASFTQCSLYSIPHIITCNIEHPAVLSYLLMLNLQNKIDLTILKVDKSGFVSPDDVEHAFQNNTVLVTIMHSNNEIGTIQDIREIGIRVLQWNSAHHENIILFHSDAAQSISKVDVDVEHLGVDMLTIVGHKYGAPKGISALYISNATVQRKHIPSFLVGGGQERGIRSGTECVPLIVGLGEASRISKGELHEMQRHLLICRIKLIELISDSISNLSSCDSDGPLLQFNGPAVCYDLDYCKHMLENSSLAVAGDILNTFPSLLNTLSISFRKIKSKLLMPLIAEKVACSAGSACHSSTDGDHMSPVLVALGVSLEYGFGTLRISFGRHTTVEDITNASRIIVDNVASLLINSSIN